MNRKDTDIRAASHDRGTGVGGGLSLIIIMSGVLKHALALRCGS